ncbi:MAG: hypothetical protein KJN78_10475, partial [Gammaproteobacteria bacterium]|nr:hypothetical protein [Gammaproteobacteria bacterium]
MMGDFGMNGWLGQYPEYSALIILAVGVLLAFIARKGVSTLSVWLNKAAMHKSVRVAPVISAGFTQVLQLSVFWG